MKKSLQVLIIFGILYVAACENSENSSESSIRQGKIAFINGATTMLTSLAQDLISRSTASSQVLSLNLTNLVILLILKALIFGAGAFGYGHGGHGRSVDGLIKENLSDNLSFDEFLSETELLLMLSYLKADVTNDYGCLQKIACENPSRAKEYVFTGKLFLKGSQLFTPYANDTKYERAISQVEEAASYGLRGQNCSNREKCIYALPCWPSRGVPNPVRERRGRIFSYSNALPRPSGPRGVCHDAPEPTALAAPRPSWPYSLLQCPTDGNHTPAELF